MRPLPILLSLAFAAATRTSAQDLQMNPVTQPSVVIKNRSFMLGLPVSTSATATGVILTDYLPPGFSFTGAVPTDCTFLDCSRTLSCNLKTVSSSKTVTVAVTPGQLVSGLNLSGVVGNEEDPNMDNNSSASRFSVLGDANGDDVVDIADVFFLINYIFAHGLSPGTAGDANADCNLDVGDVFFLINFIFAAGSPYPGTAAPSNYPANCPGGGVGFAAASGPAAPLLTSADKLTIGSLSTTVRTGTVRVPVYVKDNTGTVIGRDRTTGQRISLVSFQTIYGPKPCVTDVTFDRTSGVLNGLTAKNEKTFGEPGTDFAYAIQIPEPNGLIPFTNGGGQNGNKIGDLVFTLNACAAQTIQLPVTITGPADVLFSCDQCPPTSSEYVHNGGVTATNGFITVQ